MPYILIPFLYGLYYVAFKGFSGQQFVDFIIGTVIKTHWHGYFVIIIFQFYILHVVFIKWLKNVPAWMVLLSSLLINVTYLYISNFTDPLEWPELLRAALPYLKLPFVAWIFYFTVAFYLGRNLDVLKKYRRIGFPIAIMATVFSLSGVLYLYYSDIFSGVTSLHLGILFYTVSLFFSLYYFFGKFGHVPKWVMIISNYSFSIYLLHMLMIEILAVILPSIHIGLYTIFVFVGAVGASMVFAWIISKFPKSEFLIGQIRSVSSKRTTKADSGQNRNVSAVN